MKRRERRGAWLVAVVAICAVLLPTLGAEGLNHDHVDEGEGVEQCGTVTCAAGNPDGTVGVTGDTDGDGCTIFVPGCPEYCAQWGCGDAGGGGGSDPSLPICIQDIVTLENTNEPCQLQAPPCVSFDGAGCDPAPAPPVIPPPSIAQASADALNQVVWPTIDAGPDLSWRTFGGQPMNRVMAGFEYSLELRGYQDWSALSATASIPVTVVQNGIAYTETFSATITAVPREVRWDTGPNNNAVSQHSPPTALTCDNPGVGNWVGSGEFEDFRSYSGYGGAACAFVYWGISSEVGGPSTLSAEVIWDLTLTTSWSGDVGDVGSHTETYLSAPVEVAAFRVARVLEGARTEVTIEKEQG